MKSSVKNLILAIVIIIVAIGAYVFYQQATTKKLAEHQMAKQHSMSKQTNNADNSTNAKNSENSETGTNGEKGGRATIDLPEMKFEDVDGNPVSLSSFKGKVVILNFWASWCHICDLEMPDFATVHAEYKDNPEVAFVFANLTDGQQETKEKALKYMDKKGFSLPVYFDMKAVNFKAFGLRGVPDTLVIAKDGKLAPVGRSPHGKPYYVHVGGLSADQLRTLIKEELAQ